MQAKTDTKTGKPRRKPNRFHGRVEHAEARACDWPECKEGGEFRAPKPSAARQVSARGDGPPDWHWFCLDHVRQYNESWNFFEGLSPEEIMAARGAHPSWDGKTFPFHINPDDLASLRMRDVHNIMRDQPRFRRFAEGTRSGNGSGPGRGAAQGRNGATRSDGRPLSAEDARALATLGLDENASPAEVKSRYKDLLKKYHPDANKGDRRGERKMQAVIAAYHRLMDA